MHLISILQDICDCITLHSLWLAPPQRTSHGIINNGRVRLVSLSVCLALATAKASQNPTPSLPHSPLRSALGKAVSNATQCNFINATTNDPQAGHDDDDDDDAPH